MPLTPRSKLGHYEVLGPLGAGGMGEVYRATDTQLGREVAIKVLPASLANNPENLARFDREAKVLAALNHPNIAVIYGLAETDGHRALVMELIPGETLAERIKRSPIPVEEACGIARQIAEALEAAHERGVVHRDLKPGNVMITPAGIVKVLDFGLAAVSVPTGPSGDPENSPTLTMGMTQAGVIMGTAAYMSPEQAAGLVVDRRSDVWSFGVVLWEMLTGQRLFRGDTIAHTLAAVLQSPVDFEKLSAPSTLRKLVRRCLDRDVKHRLQWIGEARVALEEYVANPAPDAPAQATVATRRGWMAWAVAGVFGAAALTIGAAHYREVPPEQATLRYTLAPPEGGTIESFAISPDGRSVVMSVSTAGKVQLWLRTFDTLQAQPMPFTEEATFPFWSPDSRAVAFFANGSLKKVALTGGPAQVLCAVEDGRGGSWSTDGTILFGPTGAGDKTIQKVSGSGGTPVDALKIKGNFKFPTFLPDGHRFLFMADDKIRGGQSGILLASLDDGTIQQVRDEIIAPALMLPRQGDTGQLLFLQDRVLMTQPFDVKVGRTVGDPVPVIEGMASPRANYLPVSASRNGTLLYLQNGEGYGSQLTWFDRSGKRLGTVSEPGAVSTPAISPDGKFVAFTRSGPNDAHIWIHDLERGIDRRFTSGNSRNILPVWSPGGDRIAFQSNRVSSSSQFYVKPFNGGATDEELKTNPITSKSLSQWSPDGKYLVFSQQVKGKPDIWVLPLEPKGAEPELFLATEFRDGAGRISPDGHWMAYFSDETGTPEVYVRPFPKGPGVWRISAAGGNMPVWSNNGRELIYHTKEGLSSVAVKGAPAEKPSFEAGAPRVALNLPFPDGSSPARAAYDVSSDGKRFLIPASLNAASVPPLTVITNWKAPGQP